MPLPILNRYLKRPREPLQRFLKEIQLDRFIIAGYRTGICEGWEIAFRPAWLTDDENRNKC